MTDLTIERDSSTMLISFNSLAHATEVAVWDDGSMGEIWLPLEDSIRVRDAFDQIADRDLTVLTDDQLTNRFNAVKAQHEALLAELGRRIVEPLAADA